ncbi:MAG: hypothetical protein OXU61_03880, partial [Gammaproteobacteria bacterium]|nr:hypothetical protein [Gammaproteobacteria bacterium]
RRESSANRARNAHIRAMAAAGGGASLRLSAFPSLRPEGARSARFIRWIPAFAGMARWGRRNGEVGAWEWRIGLYLLDFRRVFHSLDSKSRYQKPKPLSLIFLTNHRL